MLLPRLQPPLRAALTSIARSTAGGTQTTCLNEAFAQLTTRARPANAGAVRWASHKAQGAVNKAKDGPGKRLGAKKSGEQYVIPGNIIFRQRGTHWFPGENCAMGRDHTIYATHHGYVKYYKDPEKNPKRQYIGVVFERDQVLPLPRNSMRRRRLNMTATKMETPPEVTSEVTVRTDLVAEGDANVPVSVKQTKVKQRKGEEGRELKLRPGYMYREANWEIGRAAERAKIKVREFKPRDRFTAWRKAGIRKAANAEKRGLGRKLR
ncbi:54S ribosomal protein L2 mitochondrial [Cadophora gregata]|uniref:54S ribosomal protein L2 mitochondrial n=1 Tax=Cadophora gregata TaxID=51156 RepID=UPI0026DDA29A|nr:54S ribosomal protein L2 mitochondrial [Cadophora gregata]KAK0123879.1 54S ribosomal protein L2 mitochondrial [Cadophora gregata]KAK0130220.1 54S ribosomal protein L2 mitochondrial [Cadophora gregata f. sp. sojae]